MRKKKMLFLVLDCFLVLALAAGIFFFQRKANEQEKRSISQEDLDRRYTKTVTYQDRDYPLRRNVSSVLLIGTDNYIDDSKQNEFEAFYNYNYADFLVVLVFDHVARTVTPLQICRDTMCDVPWLSVNGLVGGTVYEQITLAHSFGSGKEDSCVNTRNAVEGLLYQIPLDHYLSFSMETVPLMNDLVGGVTVKLEDDIPALGPEYVRGAEVTLRGQQALRFVRYRDQSVLDDNLRRMAHHRLYLTAFTEAARNAVGDDPDFVTKAFEKTEKYLCTDLSVENFSTMVQNLCDYEILPALTPTGQYVLGEQFAEYYVDDASLWACVKSCFCS